MVAGQEFGIEVRPRTLLRGVGTKDLGLWVFLKIGGPSGTLEVSIIRR